MSDTPLAPSVLDIALAGGPWRGARTEPPATDPGLLASSTDGWTLDELARRCTFFTFLCHDLR